MPDEPYAAGRGQGVGGRDGVGDQVADEDLAEASGSAPAWMRDSSKRSSTIPASRSTSARIWRW